MLNLKLESKITKLSFLCIIQNAPNSDNTFVKVVNCKYSKNNYQACHTSEDKVGEIPKCWCNFTTSSSGGFQSPAQGGFSIHLVADLCLHSAKVCLQSPTAWMTPQPEDIFSCMADSEAISLSRHSKVHICITKHILEIRHPKAEMDTSSGCHIFLDIHNSREICIGTRVSLHTLNNIKI